MLLAADEIQQAALQIFSKTKEFSSTSFLLVEEKNALLLSAEEKQWVLIRGFLREEVWVLNLT